jgi:cytoskeletal protein CcmA (bactofilin family)
MITRNMYTSALLSLALFATTADATSPGAKLIVLDGTDNISTTFQGGSAGYNSDAFLQQSPTNVPIGTGNVTPSGTQFELNVFLEGDELVFGIFVTNTNFTYYSGPADRNDSTDGLVHGTISDNNDGTFTVGFEDIFGGGDNDYNDINFDVTSESGVGLVMVPDDLTDSDDDGIRDYLDNCIFEPNFEQIDSDENGIGDACEYTENLASCTLDYEQFSNGIFTNYETTLPEQTVFANTYVSAGAGSTGGETIYGNILANTYVTMGAGSTVTGDIQTGTILTTGDSATVEGSTLASGASTLGASSTVNTLQSGTAVTLGASSQVNGLLEYGAVVTYGASATSGSDVQNTTVPVIIDEHQGVLDAQYALNNLTGGTTIVPGDIAVDTTFYPGVYHVNGLLSVTAGVTLTLDTQGDPDAEFIFNFSNYLSFGAGVNVVVIGGTDDTRVIWNATGGYVSVGANANIVGTILAKEYVSTGANSSVTGFGSCSGAVYSGASYVSIGANAAIGQ